MVYISQTALQGNIDKKADKATTLVGYNISDAYAKAEADSAISTAAKKHADNAVASLKADIEAALT